MPINNFDDVPNLDLWLEAREITGLADAAAVATWNDASGNGRNATAVTAPTYRTNVVNGEPSVRFLSGSSMSLPNFLTGFAAGEVFIVARNHFDPPNSNALTGFHVQGWGSASAANADTFFTDGNIYSRFGTANRKNCGNPVEILVRPYLLNFWSANNDWAARLNGFQIFATASNTVGWGTSPHLGLWAAQSTNSCSCDLLAVVFYGRKLTTQERTDIEDLVSSRYGIAMNAPRTVAAGNTSNGATWSGGVVPTGQAAVIGHAVTVDADLSVDDLQVANSMTVATGVFVTVVKDIYSNHTVTLQNNSRIRGNPAAGQVRRWITGSANNQANSKITSIATAGNLAHIENIGAGKFFISIPGRAASSPPVNSCEYDLAFVRLTGLGDSADEIGISLNNTGVKPFKLRDCEINDCAALPNWELGFVAVSNVEMRRNKWTNKRGLRSATIRIVNPTAVNPADPELSTTKIVECSFDGWVDFRSYSGVWISDCFFFIHSLSSPASGTGSFVSGCFNRAATNGDDTVRFPLVRDSYLLQDQLSGNPHFQAAFSNTTVTGMIHDFPHPFGIDTGDGFLLGDGSTAQNIVLERNIIVPSISKTGGVRLPSAQLANFGNGSSPPASGNHKAFHNTISGWGILFGEFGENAEIFSEVRSNISYRSEPNTARIVWDFTPADPAHDLARGANCTHNGIYNALEYTDPANGNAVYKGYRHGFATSGTPGANDIVDVDPQFVEWGRCFATWVVHKGAYAGPADPNDWQAAEVRAALDAGFALLQADPSLISSDLMPWVREGYRPTNELYRNAAHDGMTPGAVEMSAPVASSPDPRLNLQATPLGPDVLLEWDNPAGDTATVNKVWRQV